MTWKLAIKESKIIGKCDINTRKDTTNKLFKWIINQPH